MNNIYLYGPPGSGKTTVGHLFAEQQKRLFIDLDREIERTAGRSIPEIFADGESVFRELELKVLRQVSNCKRCVIALGGGALLNSEARRIAESTGRVALLTCDRKMLLERIRYSQNRPLLAGDAEKRLTDLLTARAEHYASFKVKFQRFAVIGHPVAHSLSPVMHAANFAARELAATYEKFDVEPGQVASFLAAKKREGFTGINVTIPHKVETSAALDRTDESVRLCGACNTVKFEADGTVSGFNTDMGAFADILVAHNCNPRGKNVFIFGRGGAGKAIAAAAKRIGAGTVTAVGRGSWDREAAYADIIVNATPVGLKESDTSLLPASVFRRGQFVLDLIPTRAFPPTAAAARQAGADAVGGLEFLVAQGAKSFEIWTGLQADRETMYASLVSRA